MNRTDKARIDRLYSLINVVPLPSSGMGMQTGSIAGCALYAEDMRVLLPAIQSVLLGMMALDSGNPELEEDVDFKDPDRMFDAIEVWVQQRHAENWKSMSTTPNALYLPHLE